MCLRDSHAARTPRTRAPPLPLYLGRLGFRSLAPALTPQGLRPLFRTDRDHMPLAVQIRSRLLRRAHSAALAPALWPCLLNLQWEGLGFIYLKTPGAPSCEIVSAAGGARDWAQGSARSLPTCSLGLDLGKSRYHVLKTCQLRLHPPSSGLTSPRS